MFSCTSWILEIPVLWPGLALAGLTQGWSAPAGWCCTHWVLHPLVPVLKRPRGDGDAQRSEGQLAGAWTCCGCEGWSCARQKGKEGLLALLHKKKIPHFSSLTTRAVSEYVTGVCNHRTDPSLGAWQTNVIRAGGSALTEDAGGGKVGSLLDEAACAFPCWCLCSQQNNCLSGVIARY